MRKITFIYLFILCTFYHNTYAQPSIQYVNLQISPKKWTYEKKEEIIFQLYATAYDQPVNKQVVVHYDFGMDGFEHLHKGKVALKEGRAEIGPFSVDKAGFYACRVHMEYEGKTIKSFSKAGYQVAEIQAVTPLPEDFTAYWEQAITKAREVSLKPEMTLIPDLCTSEVNVYHISYHNTKEGWRGTGKMYGLLNIPKNSKGPLPVIIGYPGAGVRPYAHRYAIAEKEVIYLQMGIHGIPVNLEPSLYQDLATGALANYQIRGLDQRDTYYYHRVILGCVKAVDFVKTLPEANLDQILVTGGSQGGALSIMVAALHPDVKGLAAHYPAMADMMAYRKHQTGGWPHQFKHFDEQDHPNWLKVAPYYDVVNFARQLKVPGLYLTGYHDDVCPPMPFYAVYNNISAPKALGIYPNAGHWQYPEQSAAAEEWLLRFFSELNNN
ncbi:acetylxylan esterase [Persicobacter diffluens]|uniref:Cephalosporin deacetylase n=1 Tax=Persicobacter diffluens TaxID=981 RepID=A0AAN4W477_9BACT|nr:cephalosporin deacetylase [Persicobacter diffluens]